MTYTRAASAAGSHRAKQELVRLLFGPQYYRKGPEAHRMLDHSIYTHAELKSAYLQRIHELHPDKRRNNQNSPNVLSNIIPNLHENNNNNNSASIDNSSQEFISLQDAWRRYEEFAKVLSKVENGSREANFTLFGVGCSFSDNDAERDKRNEITDQACRGWFAAGQLGEGKDDKTTKTEGLARSSASSLLDDDMFVHEESSSSSPSPASSSLSQPKPPASKKSLIDHMVRQKR